MPQFLLCSDWENKNWKGLECLDRGVPLRYTKISNEHKAHESKNDEDLNITGDLLKLLGNDARDAYT